jgi:hypothetical protein
VRPGCSRVDAGCRSRGYDDVGVIDIICVDSSYDDL